MAARRQFVAQLEVVIDLAVEDDGGVAVVAVDGLVAALQVDDLEPHRAQADMRRMIDTILVGPAVGQRQRQAADTIFGNTTTVGKPNNAAHSTNPHYGRSPEKFCSPLNALHPPPRSG